VGELETFPRPSLAVDPAILSVEDGRLITLLWRRENPPGEGEWALPGVFVNESESLEAAVARGLATKAGITDRVSTHQMLTWNNPGRDPRGWVVTVAYLVPLHAARAASANGSTERFVVEVPRRPAADMAVRLLGPNGELVRPAFDHDQILGHVVWRLRDQIWRSDIALELLPKKFTLRELQQVFEAVLGRPLNKDSFRRRVTQTMDLVRPTGELEEGVDHRPAELYRARPARG
jgi:ADP-ribose pyrophosphatase YjhB (NUDIX family)